MYEFISGRLADLTPAYAVIETGGVGYFLNISLQTFSRIEGLTEVQLWVHFAVREDAQVLWGFATREERELFRRLVGVSGVGGGTARMVLSTHSPAELAAIISSENAVLLKNVKGLGLKTAQKIIVELRDKVAGIASGDGAGGLQGAAAISATNALQAEAVAALAMLGFSRAASDKAVRTVVGEGDGGSLSVEEVIRRALMKL